MKRIACAAACLLVAGMGFTQTSTSSENSDTLRAGNFIILKKKPETLVIENTSRDPLSYHYQLTRLIHRRHVS